MHKNYRLFWTGGFDSTFRLAELSRRPVKISPVYIVFQDRLAVTPLELKAHERILAYLKSRPETNGYLSTFPSKFRTAIFSLPRMRRSQRV